ncbi:putative ABC transporter permease subunit YbbP [Plesiomonas sp.]|uniref:putative ABC transporter permease subunit YbbP n=1 Tax=Plesiomonas sp. TaxID=2486279 RepID=UPI003F32B9CE
MIRRWFWREWKTPSLLLVWISLSLAFACVLALSGMGQRLTLAMSQQGRDLLAADRVISSNNALSPEWLAQAEQQGLQLSEQLMFMSMAFAGDQMQLVAVKAVDAAYPLYGTLQRQPDDLQLRSGQVMVAPRLLALLGLEVGATLELGDGQFTIAGTVEAEPDSGFNPFMVAPRVLMLHEDAAKTGAIQPGGRLSYRYLFAGSPSALDEYGRWLTPKLQTGQRWYGAEESGGTVGNNLTRARQFILLSALLMLLLAGAAVAVSVSHYCQRRFDLVAVLKTLGATRAQLRTLILGHTALLLLLSVLAGSLAGMLLEQALLRAIRGLFSTPLPAVGVMPWVWAFSCVLLITVLVGARPYLQLLQTPPLRVLRRSQLGQTVPLHYYLPVCAAIIVLLLIGLAGASPLLWALLGGVLLLALILGLAGWGSLLLLRRVAGYEFAATSGRKLPVWRLSLRLAMARLLRRPQMTLVQLSAFSFSFMLLALLLLLRGDLLTRWQQQLPPDSPNYFLINIAPTNTLAVTSMLAQHQVQPSTLYPVVRGRLSEINGQPAQALIASNNQGSEALERELNLTWSASIPLSASLLQSSAILQIETPDSNGSVVPRVPVSVERGIAERLGLRVGDQLVFTVATRRILATVGDVRTVQWESLQPNFYFIFPAGVLESLPQTMMTSFRYQETSESQLAPDQRLLVQLTRQFPTINVLDVTAIITQVSAILQQVSRSLELMVALVLLCGAVLLVAQVQVGMQQRRHELVLYRTLGASGTLMRQTLRLEFWLLGAVAGVVAAVGADATLWLLQRYAFDFPAQLNLWIWGLLPLCSAVSIGVLGELACRPLLRHNTLEQLRRLGSD